MKILLSLLAFLYVLSPIDLIPEWFLGFRGLLDDIVVLWLMWRYFKVFKRPPGGFGWGSPGQNTTRTGKRNDTDDRTQSSRGQQQHVGKDPYEVLGVPGSASPEEIRAAYLELVNKYHPDKVEHLGDEFKQMAENRFKDIQEAYQKLKKT